MIEKIRGVLSSPTGWLVSPTRDFLLFFIKDTKAQKSSPNVMTQLWYCSKEGLPGRLKNTRRIDIESASETWTELISNGWELVEHQINDNVA